MKNKEFKNFLFSSPSSLHRILFYFLGIANALSLVYFLTLGYYNRLALDDYCYFSAQNDYGFLSPFTFWYHNYQGRFAPQFLINVITKVYETVHSLLPFTTLLLLLFIWATYKLIRRVMPFLSFFEILNLSVLSFSIFVINNYEFNTFYWLNASAMYFGGVLFLLFGINAILSSHRNIFTYVMLIFCAIYVGSSSETFAFIWSVIGGMIILAQLIKIRFDVRTFLTNIHFKKLLLAFVFCAISFAIMFFAPGNGVRLKITAVNMHQHLPLPFHQLVPAAIHAFQKFSVITILKLPFWILFSLPFLYLGNTFRDSIKLNFISFKRFMLILLCFVLFLWICLIPTVSALGELGPKRSLTDAAFYITCFIMILSFMAGMKIKVIRPGFVWVGMIPIILWTIMIINLLKNDIPEVKKYAQSEDKRIAYLKTMENKFVKDTLLLDPLYIPVSPDADAPTKRLGIKLLGKAISNGFINREYTHHPIQPNEIKPAPQDFVNDCICRELHLEFHVKLKTDSVR
jgi:hypothetical protein